MTTAEVLYDLASGIIGAIMGGVISLMLNARRNRTLMNEIDAQERALQSMRDENARLLRLIEEKESKILAGEQRIIAATTRGRRTPRPRP